MFKNKKGQLINNLVLWLFSVFFYFTIGFPIFKSIIDSLILSSSSSGLMYYLEIIAPYIPIFMLAMWGYFLGKETGLIGKGTALWKYLNI